MRKSESNGAQGNLPTVLLGVASVIAAVALLVVTVFFTFSIAEELGRLRAGFDGLRYEMQGLTSRVEEETRRRRDYEQELWNRRRSKTRDEQTKQD